VPAWPQAPIITAGANHYNDRVFAVRYIALAGLVVWLGGMIVLGLLVAPSTFRVLQAQDPVGGRVLAGAVFGEILRQFHLLAYLCGGLILVCLLIMKLVGPPPRAFPLRAAIVVVVLALAAYSGVPVSREIAQIQSQVSGPMNKLPDTDPRRVRFNRLHSTSALLMTINMALGLVLLFWYVRE
jgi:hypothetical protein